MNQKPSHSFWIGRILKEESLWRAWHWASVKEKNQLFNSHIHVYLKFLISCWTERCEEPATYFWSMSWVCWRGRPGSYLALEDLMTWEKGQMHDSVTGVYQVNPRLRCWSQQSIEQNGQNPALAWALSQEGRPTASLYMRSLQNSPRKYMLSKNWFSRFFLHQSKLIF